MNAADRRRVTPVLGGACAALALCLIAAWAGFGRGVAWHDTAAPPRLPEVRTATPPPVVPALDEYSDVWTRPLFSPTRTLEAAGGDGPAAHGDLQLTGVILLPGLRMAIIHDKATSVDYRLVEGRPGRGAPVLVELEPRSAVIETAGTRMRLQLLPTASPAVGPGAAQPAAAAEPATVRVATPPSSAKVSAPDTRELARTMLAGLSPREREVADRVLSGFNPGERDQMIRAFSSWTPAQREQAIRAAMAGPIPLDARARILKALIEERLRKSD